MQRHFKIRHLACHWNTENSAIRSLRHFFKQDHYHYNVSIFIALLTMSFHSLHQIYSCIYDTYLYWHSSLEVRTSSGHKLILQTTPTTTGSRLQSSLLLFLSLLLLLLLLLLILQQLLQLQLQRLQQLLLLPLLLLLLLQQQQQQWQWQQRQQQQCNTATVEQRQV